MNKQESALVIIMSYMNKGDENGKDGNSGAIEGINFRINIKGKLINIVFGSIFNL